VGSYSHIFTKPRKAELLLWSLQNDKPDHSPHRGEMESKMSSSGRGEMRGEARE